MCSMHSGSMNMFIGWASLILFSACCSSIAMSDQVSVANFRDEVEEIRNLKQEMIGIKLQFQQEINDLREIKQYYSELKEQFTEEKCDKRRSDSKGSSAFGFTAYHPHGVGYYQEGDRITFSDILSNFGNHYDPSTSTFTCPLHGIYFFTVSFNSHRNDMIAYIIRNGKSIGRAMADIDTSYNPNTHTSAFVIIECMAGDIIWVECQKSDGELYGYDQSAQFNGYMLNGL